MEENAIENYLRQLPPHVANREAAQLLRGALNEIGRLRGAIEQTLNENGHLADGENCTLIVLKRALRKPNQ